MQSGLPHQRPSFPVCVRIVLAATRLLSFMLMPALATTPAQAQTFKVLHTFRGGADGSQPTGLISDDAGSLYGVTTIGGNSSVGTVFMLDKSGKQTVLYSFTGAADGGNPNGGLVRDNAGNLYGTTRSGGTKGYGVVFELNKFRKLTTLYGFTGYPMDGEQPLAGLIRDNLGNLYGTTNHGGGSSGYGTVFKISRSGTETVLYRFQQFVDGAYPFAGVIRDGRGNLYGTTSGGGALGMGTVFKLNKAGRETVLHNFAGSPNDGSGPDSGSLIRDGAGNFYGTTSGGGPANAGTVFRLDKSGKEVVLYSFTGGTDGGSPYAGLVRDSAGNLYGTTVSGGSASCQCGTVFKVDKAGKETVLHNFTGQADGAAPVAGLVLDKAGNLYGCANLGGAAGDGTAFELVR